MAKNSPKRRPTGESGGEALDVFDLDRLRQIIELMKEHDLGQVDLRQGEQRIALRRGSAYAPPPPPPPTRSGGDFRPAPVAAPASVPPQPDNAAYITSPMVGTFYSRPNPKSEPFVKIGDQVSSETSVCIVEAMKTFNEIAAEVSGKILAVLVEDGEPVEFGQKLFKVEKSK